MNLWDVTDYGPIPGTKVLLHRCTEHHVTGPGDSIRGYLCIGFLDNFYCMECHATAPQKMVDLALLAGVKTSVEDIYVMQMNIGYKILLRFVRELEKKAEKLSG